MVLSGGNVLLKLADVNLMRGEKRSNILHWRSKQIKTEMYRTWDDFYLYVSSYVSKNWMPELNKYA